MIASDDPHLQLRTATRADDPFARHLFAAIRAGPLVQAGLPDAMLEDLLDQQFRWQAIGRERQFPGAKAFVIARLDRSVGGLLLHCAKPRWHVVDIALLPCCCGQGVGTAIMGGIEAAARLRGIGALTLTVAATNHRARHFYQRLGFTETATVAGGVYLNAIKQLAL